MGCDGTAYNFRPVSNIRSDMRYFHPEVQEKKPSKPSTTNHNNCHLLCHLPVILEVFFANSVDPDQTAPIGAV